MLSVEKIQFQDIKRQFSLGDVDQKIEIYTTVEGLTQAQYKELLRLFPLDQLPRLETALQ